MPYADMEKQRKFQREWVAARRAEFVEGNECICCGSEYELMYVFPGQPKRKISWSRSREAIAAELAKGEGEWWCRTCRQEMRDAAMRERRPVVPVPSAG